MLDILKEIARMLVILKKKKCCLANILFKDHVGDFIVPNARNRLGHNSIQNCSLPTL